MIVHLMCFSSITKSYAKFIRENFDINNHLFIFWKGLNDHGVDIIKEKNKIIINNKLELILVYLRLIFFKYDRIYIHGFYFPGLIIFLYIYRKYLKISNWIIWGGDLYCYEKRKDKILNKLWYKIEDYVKRNVAYVNTLVAEDYDVAKKYYKVKGKYKEAYYSNPNKIYYQKIDQLIKDMPKKENNCICIQVGNSAASSNNHKDILNILLKYKDENIKIYCQLSYGGSEEYKNDLIAYGYKLYNNKFIPILDFMPRDEYFKNLANMDILVFNHNRQQGLGNISMFSFLEKKVYLRNDITSWNHLTKKLKLVVNSYEDIRNQTFKEFIKNNATGNKDKILKTNYSKEYIKNIWEKNFKN